MRIAALGFRNWKCFGGEHRIELGPKSYAIVARSETDADRSNWLGKSSLLESIGFVLYGRHHSDTKDDIITRGEKGGEAWIEFDDGTIAKRTYGVGKPIVLYYGAAMKDPAQSMLLEKIGLSERDFLATCFLEQREIARLIRARPKDRMEIVSDWLSLGPIERAEEIERANVSRLLEGREKGAQVVSTAKAKRRSALSEIAHVDAIEHLVLDPKATREHIEERVKKYAKEKKEAEEKLHVIEGDWEKNERLLQLATRVTEYDALVADGQKLVSRLEELQAQGVTPAKVKALREKAVEATTAKTTATREESMRKVVAKGDFDGKCPVATIECPAKDQINARLSKNRKAADAAREAREKAEKAADKANRLWNEADAKAQEISRLDTQITNMRDRARVLKKAKDEVEDTPPIDRDKLRSRKDEASNRLHAATVAHQDARRRLAQAEQADADEAAVAAAEEGIAKKIAVHRAAAIIFGRNGAQKRVAEAALLKIEEGACDVLRDCGIPLELAVRWSYDGSGLAVICEQCGHPFPKSEKIKVCARCGAERGPHVVNRLDIVLSDRSGAAEDLAGVALQLSASRWLRDARGSSWASMMIDEPFGQLDRSNKKALSAHIASMLAGRYGATQALVIAHDSSVLDALPGRIEVVSSNGRSSVRVIT